MQCPKPLTTSSREALCRMPYPAYAASPSFASRSRAGFTRRSWARARDTSSAAPSSTKMPAVSSPAASWVTFLCKACLCRRACHECGHGVSGEAIWRQAGCCFPIMPCFVLMADVLCDILTSCSTVAVSCYLLLVLLVPLAKDLTPPCLTLTCLAISFRT